MEIDIVRWWQNLDTPACWYCWFQILSVLITRFRDYSLLCVYIAARMLAHYMCECMYAFFCGISFVVGHWQALGYQGSVNTNLRWIYIQFQMCYN